MSGKLLLLIYIWNFHVLNHLLLVYMCKLHWNLNTMFVWQVNYLLIYVWNFHVLSNLLLICICKLHWNRMSQVGLISLLKCVSKLVSLSVLDISQVHFLLIYICNFHVLNHFLLINICKLHWNLNTMFVCQVHFLLIYICNFHVLNHFLLIYICKLHWNRRTMLVLVDRTWPGQVCIFLLIYIWNSYVFIHFLLIYIWNSYVFNYIITAIYDAPILTWFVLMNLYTPQTSMLTSTQRNFNST
jgi:hypothetical protein